MSVYLLNARRQCISSTNPLTCIISQGVIENYLLEKSRVVNINEGERNYHIFYQLLQACKQDASLASTLHLKTAPEDYNYLNQSSITAIEGVNDLKEVRRSIAYCYVCVCGMFTFTDHIEMY